MGGAWVFPGGALADPSEAPASCAVRELSEEVAIELAAHDLVGFSRWITPTEAKIRFDTLFFVAPCATGQSPRPDGGECVEAAWLRPAEALALHERSELCLVFPTIKHLEALRGFASVDAVLQSARERRIEPITPQVICRDGKREIVLPGEPGYRT